MAETPRRGGLPRTLRLGAGLLLLLALLAILAPLLARQSPAAVDLDAILASPSMAHWIGTDELGRDVLSRILHGGRVSLAVGALSALIALTVGLPLGSLAGYRGRFADAVISRAIEAMLCFPTLLLALVLLATAPPWLEGLPDAGRVALVLGVAGWTPVARYLRGEFLRLGSSEMVAAARATGAGDLRVMSRHILPAALAPVLVTVAFSVAAAILFEGALSYLGLGVRPPTPTWGGMLKSGANHLDRAWWLTLFPGCALFAVVLGCNLLGEGIPGLARPEGCRAPLISLPDGRFVRRLVGVLACVLAGILLSTRYVAVPWVVAGPSMEPTLLAGDHVIVDLWTYRRRPPREGEVALLDAPWGGPIVKRIAPPVPDPGALGDGRYRVLGDNAAESADSRTFGSVERGRFRGRIVWRYWPLARAGPIR